MNSIGIGLVCAAFIFAGGLFGLMLQRLLPGHHLGKEMQDLVKLSAGTIATLTALILGLLVSSAKSSFDGINSGITQGAAKYILLDRALAHYGPAANPTREQLKRVLAAGLEAVWPADPTGIPALSAFERSNGMEMVQGSLRELTPQNDIQRQALSQAQQLAGDLSQIRWLLVEQAQNQLPLPLLVILVFWLALLFVSFGLFAPRHISAIVVLSVGATAISAAIFLVLELNQPLDGIIKVSSAPLRNALQHLGQ